LGSGIISLGKSKRIAAIHKLGGKKKKGEHLDTQAANLFEYAYQKVCSHLKN